MSGDQWVALCSVIVSGITSSLALWLTYRERRASYRQLIYSRQLEGYASLMVHVYAAYRAVTGLTVATHKYRTEDENRQIASDLKSHHAHIQENAQIWSIVFHDKINLALSHVQNTLIFVVWALEMPELATEPIEESLGKDRERFIAAYKTLIQQIRQHLRVDPLSNETLALIGKAPSPPKKDQRAKDNRTPTANK